MFPKSTKRRAQLLYNPFRVVSYTPAILTYFPFGELNSTGEQCSREGNNIAGHRDNVFGKVSGVFSNGSARRSPEGNNVNSRR